ncbi:hypothetical protein F6Y24_14050 [Xanthomonas arboricola pv. pruni]|nr:hypothetical protein F6Y24_14050 [Xanthomonas arboricola pv. pruni]RST63903.1 hypothetical protein EJK96_22360 [Xanthomonas arboricola pv. pruni]RST82360.1 hypothetical protein EJL05_01505 [Xanthomonas arboricola pv. pruni]
MRVDTCLPLGSRWEDGEALIERTSDPTSAGHAPLLTMHTDHPDGSLSAHRRGTLRGMDAAEEPTRTYLRRVLRGWAGKDLAAKPQTSRPAADLSALHRPRKNNAKAIETSNRSRV